MAFKSTSYSYIRKLTLFIICLVFVGFIGYSNTLNYRLSLRDDPSTSMVIGWEQDGGSGATVYYGTTDFGQNWSSYPNSHGVDRSVSAKGMDNSFARLSGLTPNTAYYFVIKDSDGVSPRFWFKTTPMGNTEPISAISGGDSRAYLDDSPREAANTMVSKLRPDLIFFGGDYTWLDTGLEWGEWMDDWQLTTTSDGKMVPVFWERGNHELSSGVVHDLFDIPLNNGEEYNAISIGGDFIRMYTLNSEISMAGDQKTWLENDLAANYNNHDWNFAQYHTPMRPHTTDKSNGDVQYSAWADIFHQYRVQLVMESDAHDVKTTFPVKPSNGPNSEDGFELDTISGTVYIGEGCWGAPLRTADWNKSWTINSGSFNSFHWLKIGKDTIEIRTIETDNAASVASVSDNDKFIPPAGINIWNPSSGPVTYIINQKYIGRPEVSVTYPINQQFFANPLPVTIQANAMDNSSVTKVNFFVNDVLVGSDLTAPYEMPWTIPLDGSYDVAAWAIDDEGWHNVSNTVQVFAGEIEMTILLGSDDDDAEENKDDGSVDLSSSDIELCVEDLVWPLSDNDQWVGLRFPGVEIPKGANILDAYIQFTADEVQSDACDLDIYIEDVDNSTAFTSSSSNLSSRTRSTPSVQWNVSNWSSDNNGVNERTPDVSSLVQLIVDRSGWQIGNSIAFLIEGSGTRSAYSRDENTSKSAKLHITLQHESPQSVDSFLENELGIYPNPAEDVVNIHFKENVNYSIEIFNLNGQLMYLRADNIGTSQLSLKSINLSSGVYIFKINNQTQKVIIK